MENEVFRMKALKQAEIRTEEDRKKFDTDSWDMIETVKKGTKMRP